ncbi:hypothetical protein [Aliarcobacter cryaerophilus]|uniref:hypothetical protein n=1 Tax=Aliarcobacter cryaerophilus TaxID=28198 RepID=UPI000824F8F0|nr:hypothetical protein [Aliarcobacter cryaerophilus]
MDSYQKMLKQDISLVAEYYRKSIIKTEQQKMLEGLLVKDDNFFKADEIADICCGGGDFELSPC